MRILCEAEDSDIMLAFFTPILSQVVRGEYLQHIVIGT